MTSGNTDNRSLAAWLRELRANARRHIAYFRAVYEDPRTPAFSKALFWLALSYLALPFDLVPDFIPVLGQVDDAVVVPLLLYLALRGVPQDVLEGHKTVYRMS